MTVLLGVSRWYQRNARRLLPGFPFSFILAVRFGLRSPIDDKDDDDEDDWDTGTKATKRGCSDRGIATRGKINIVINTFFDNNHKNRVLPPECYSKNAFPGSSPLRESAKTYSITGESC